MTGIDLSRLSLNFFDHAFFTEKNWENTRCKFNFKAEKLIPVLSTARLVRWQKKCKMIRHFQHFKTEDKVSNGLLSNALYRKNQNLWTKPYVSSFFKRFRKPMVRSSQSHQRHLFSVSLFTKITEIPAEIIEITTKITEIWLCESELPSMSVSFYHDVFCCCICFF